MTPIAASLPERPITITRRQFGYAVNPGTFTVDFELGLGPAFVLRNRSNLPATVTFPDAAILDGRGEPIVAPFTIGAGQQNDRHLTVSVKTEQRWFEYSVAMTSAGIEAEGGSRPGIEIVP